MKVEQSKKKSITFNKGKLEWNLVNSSNQVVVFSAARARGGEALRGQIFKVTHAVDHIADSASSSFLVTVPRLVVASNFALFVEYL